jgi:hypothetical protein
LILFNLLHIIQIGNQFFSHNSKFPIKYVENYPEKPWNWFAISCNPNLTMEYLEKHPEKPWDWYRIAHITNLTMEFVEKHPDEDWNLYMISKNMFTHRFKELKSEKVILFTKLKNEK